MRNRIIAALCDACVVVEANGVRRRDDHGPVRERLRPRRVRAARLARRNRAAAGCNALIKDGAQLLLDPGDVLLELGPGPRRRAWQPALRRRGSIADEAATLAALGGEPATIDQLVGPHRRCRPAELAGVLPPAASRRGHIEQRPRALVAEVIDRAPVPPTVAAWGSTRSASAPSAAATSSSSSLALVIVALLVAWAAFPR